MAVKGRLRFEILRRDNHQCRYCGAAAPDVKLTVDHVVPESLGGSDAPSNLVAACTSCNAGKASIAPDSALVDDVAADALRYSSALRRAMEERSEKFSDLVGEIDRFGAAWARWGYGAGEQRVEVERANDWRQTVERWLVGGLTIDELVYNIPAAMNDKIKGGNEWRYFCGIGWNMLSELQEHARELAALGDVVEASPSPMWRCAECGAPDPPAVCSPCAFDQGRRLGFDRGLEVDRWARASAEDELLEFWTDAMRGMANV